MQCRWNNFWGLVKITKISYNNNSFPASWFQVRSHPTNPDPLRNFKRALWSSFLIRRLQLLTWTHFKDLKSKNLSKEKKNFRPLSIKSQVRGGGGCRLCRLVFTFICKSLTEGLISYGSIRCCYYAYTFMFFSLIC